MPALVPKLVEMASTSSVSTTDLLHCALVVAQRLAVPDLVDWIKSELNGYTGEIPDYRILRGQLKAISPTAGLTTLRMESAEYQEIFSIAKITQGIPELIASENNTNPFLIGFPPQVEHDLMALMPVPMKPAIKLLKSQLQTIHSNVRSRILIWGLELESSGIMGEGMSFKEQEQTIVHNQNFHFNNVSNLNAQIGSNGSTQTQTNTTTGHSLDALRGLIDALGEALDRGAMQGEAADEIRAELATLRAQAASPRPKLDIIKAAALSIKEVAEGAAGNILGEIARSHITTLMALAAS